VDFEDFYAAHFERVFRAAYVSCHGRDAALDATQEAFERAYARWRRLRKEPWASGWVMTTALRLARRKSREVAVGHSLGVDESSAPETDSGELLEALRRLSERQRQATVLFYVGDLSVPAIASLMGVSEGTVKAHLAQARRALRKSLEGADV
jgi:RNA polymerase sigma-70 factor (ECF subfamily)